LKSGSKPLQAATPARIRSLSIGVGDNSLRQKLANQFSWVTWLTARHPSSWIDSSVILEEGPWCAPARLCSPTRS
jgi:hypothetical protein